MQAAIALRSELYSHFTLSRWPRLIKAVYECAVLMRNGLRTQLSDSGCRQICELHHENRDLSQDKLTALIATRLEKPTLKRPAVTGVLKDSAKWLRIENSAASKTVEHTAAKHENLEKILMEWFGQERAKGAQLGDKLYAD